MNTTAIYVRRLAPYGLAMLLGACDQGTVMPDTEFRLTAFPLPNRTHSSVGINTVFDHSMPTLYCPDGRVVAFTGETGSGQPIKLLANFGCGDLYGFAQAGGGSFHVNGNYTGIGTPGILYYDGHPGYDFRTSDQCPGTSATPTDLCPLPGKTGRIRVRAAAAGVVACSDFDGHGGCPEGPGVVKIKHQDNYYTIYMHLESAAVQTGDSVAAGQDIGVGGGRGESGPDDFLPHLHFEVRKGTVPVDPYGWEPTDEKDPYTRASSYWMWSDG
jgi:hypothetical protein